MGILRHPQILKLKKPSLKNITKFVTQFHCLVILNLFPQMEITI